MSASAQQAVELSIGGMTCASCAARVEKKLNKLDDALQAALVAGQVAAGAHGRRGESAFGQRR